MPKVQRKTLPAGYVRIGSRTTRIKMIQNPFRPFKARGSLLRRNLLQKNPWWWVTHRRGILRRNVGENQLEARAVPKDQVKGTLPERIVLRWLINAHFVPEVDFTFQSSLLGGRLEIGGLVVDFMFNPIKMVIQVQGPTHSDYARVRKDEEQVAMLAAMGFQTIFLDMDLIYNEPRFDAKMREIFNMGYFSAHGDISGMYMGAGMPEDDYMERVDAIIRQVDRIYTKFQEAETALWVR